MTALGPDAMPQPRYSAEPRKPVLEVEGICKTFGSVRALRGMCFELDAGEVHVLFGENGAGKSVLINIIAGALAPDSGAMTVAGEAVNFRDVHDARKRGIAAMFQEFSLAPALSVEENLFLGAEPRDGIFIRIAERRRLARQTLERLGFDLDPRETVSRLSRAQQQLVELAKALLLEPRVLILDEPTASLSEKETETLFGLVRSLRQKGVSIIYITHRMAEIHAIGDRVTVMRDGARVATVDVSRVSQRELVELMTGRPVQEFYPAIAQRPGPTRVEIHDLTTVEGQVRNVSLEIRAGEVLGIAGLVGCGKSEIGRAIFGLVPIKSGKVEVDGNEIARPTPRRLMERGVTYITSDRRNEGLMLQRSTRENIALAALSLPALSSATFLHAGAEKDFARKLGERMHVRPLNLNKSVASYSGGNQQKVLIAKALGRDARVLIFDEPTVGIDVSARVEVYAFIKDLVEGGAAVVIISSDLPEVLALSHRLCVVRDGSIVDRIERDDISESRVLHGFFGTSDSATPSQGHQA
jgi:ribose transport system ATP-binding protein